MKIIAFNTAQIQDFEKDIDLVRRMDGLENIDEVCVVALASSTYFKNHEVYGRDGTLEVFEKKHITWQDLSEKYNSPILKRADDLYKFSRA